MQDLRGCLDAALEQVETLRNHLQRGETERRQLEQKIQEVRRENQEAKKALEESLRDSNRYHCSLELITRYTIYSYYSYYNILFTNSLGFKTVDEILVDLILFYAVCSVSYFRF